MIAESEQIIDHALKLPVSLRAFLADRLIESLEADEEEIPLAWQEELSKRCQEIDSGAISLVDGGVVHDKIRKMVE